MQNETIQNKTMQKTIGDALRPDAQINLDTSEKESPEDKSKGQLTPQDEQIVLERLRQLGYID